MLDQLGKNKCNIENGKQEILKCIYVNEVPLTNKINYKIVHVE